MVRAALVEHFVQAKVARMVGRMDAIADDAEESHSRPQPRWVSSAVRLLEPHGATSRRVRSGWQVIAPMPNHPEGRLILETCAGSWFVAYQVMKGRLVVDDRQLNDPGWSWDEAATMMLALLVQLERKSDGSSTSTDNVGAFGPG